MSPLPAHTSYPGLLLYKDHIGTSLPRRYKSMGLPNGTDSRLNVSDFLTTDYSLSLQSMWKGRKTAHGRVS